MPMKIVNVHQQPILVNFHLPRSLDQNQSKLLLLKYKQQLCNGINSAVYSMTP